MWKTIYRKEKHLRIKGKIKSIEERTARNGSNFFLISLKTEEKLIKCFFWENKFNLSEIKKIEGLFENQEIKVWGKFWEGDGFNVSKFLILSKKDISDNYPVSPAWEELSFVIIDLETTGFSKQDEIVEIAYIKWKNGKIIKKFESLICPSKTINSKINIFNNISYELLKKATSIEKILPIIHEDLKDSIIVGHNINRFDYYYLNSAWEKHFQESLPNLTFDTYQLYKKFFPQCCKEENHNGCFGIEEIIRRITKNIFYKEKHRALSDAEDNLKIFETIIEESKRLGIWQEIYRSLEKIQRKKQATIKCENKVNNRIKH